MRKLIVITSEKSLTALNAPNGVWCGLNADSRGHFAQILQVPFSNAKSLLGQEFGYAVYDMRAPKGVCLNLEALAIVAGTVQDHGVLYLICPQWSQLAQQIDWDAKRWNGNTAIATPNFYRHFQQLIAQFQFQVTDIPPPLTAQTPRQPAAALTAEQQHILQQLPNDTADIHLITAPRGRGKSTLAGKLALQLAQQAQVLVTAKNPSALVNFHQPTTTVSIPFIAPDKLIALLESRTISPQQWLFIDEAASLPLPMLHKLCHYFDKVVLTSTTQNYEGTGRGFSLKFLPPLTRTSRHWTLTAPLRWQTDDPLETFINQLLLLDDNLPPQHAEAEIYQLLAEAHYKTTPTDLRRLFDAPNQIFYRHFGEKGLQGAVWLVKEGGMDHALSEAVWRGERRPHGNLVAQYLCFQGNLPQACQLHSQRISRIAVCPSAQRQGIGSQLVQQIIAQTESDFLSVSFGLTAPLLAFWQKQGFELVQITPNLEAASGSPSAMMILPLSAAGQAFAQQAINRFQHDFPLLPYPPAVQDLCRFTPAVDDTLHPEDWQNLHGFAYANRTFSACYASLTRLYRQQPKPLALFEEQFRQHSFVLPNHQKAWLAQARAAVRGVIANRTGK